MPWKSGRTTSFGVKRQRNADGELGEGGGTKEEEVFLFFFMRETAICVSRAPSSCRYALFWFF